MNEERKALIEEFQNHKHSVFDITRKVIQQREFSDGKEYIRKHLLDFPCREFDFFLNEKFSDPNNEIQKTIDIILMRHKDNLHRFSGLGFDLSDHAKSQDVSRVQYQGIEISLYNSNAYDFNSASDQELNKQCDSRQNEWQGQFDEVEEAYFAGADNYLKASATSKNCCDLNYGIASGNRSDGLIEYGRDPIAWTHIIFEALVAVEFHRFMHEVIPTLCVPHDMVFVIGEHDLLFVPHTFYRAKGSQWQPHQKVTSERADTSLAKNISDFRKLVSTSSQPNQPTRKIFGRR